jgi:hypothetical protein
MHRRAIKVVFFFRYKELAIHDTFLSLSRYLLNVLRKYIAIILLERRCVCTDQLTKKIVFVCGDLLLVYNRLVIKIPAKSKIV